MVDISNFEIVENIEFSDKNWKQFREIVESEGWKSDDHSVMELTPIISSTRSVFAKDKNGDFVGCVVWNEYDEIALIGFYLLKEEYRGKGIGSVIWKRAINRMPSNFTIGLRAVPEKVDMYRSKDTPIVGPTLNEFNIPWREILDICIKNERNADRAIFPIRKMNKDNFGEFLEYDRAVTGKDRSDFLKRFYFDLPFTAGNVLLDANGSIVAVAGITPTSTKESHMFKLAPIYATTLEDALTVSRSLIEFAGEQDEQAVILFHILSGTRGEKELLPMLRDLNVPTRLSGVTLFSKNNVNPTNVDLIYIAHNNSGHYDI